MLKLKAFGQRATSWEDSVLTWRRDVAKWQQLAGEALSDQVKVSVLLENAPAAIRGQLALQGHRTSADVENAIISYLGVTRFLPGGSSSPAPMEVDAIHGKGKKKGKKGEGKGKKETRKCWICDGAGHLAADCWYKDDAKQDDKKGGGKGKKGGKVSAVDEAWEQEVGAEGAGAASAEVWPLEGQVAQIKSSAVAEEEDRGWITNAADGGGWIMGLSSYSCADPRSQGICPWTSTPPERGEIMLDSGACMYAHLNG